MLNCLFFPQLNKHFEKFLQPAICKWQFWRKNFKKFPAIVSILNDAEQSLKPLIKHSLFSFLSSRLLFPQAQYSFSSHWMHSAHSTSFQWKVLQFSSWLKKQTGYCCQRLEFFLCASPLRQQIKLSLIVRRLFWTRCVHMMLAKTLIIKSKYVENHECAFYVKNTPFVQWIIFFTRAPLLFIQTDWNHLYKDHHSKRIVCFHLWIFRHQYENAAFVCVHVNYVSGDFIAV